MEIIKIIKDNYNAFSKSQKKVANYFLDNFNEAIILSSSEIAEKLNVSNTTIIRFTKALGFNGYFEFKKKIKENVNYENSPYDNLKKMSFA